MKKEGTFFFQSVRSNPRPRVFTLEKTEEITGLHLAGKSHKEICRRLGIKYDTFRKALSEKRLVLPEIPKATLSATTKSERNVLDDKCGMGKSCTNESARVLAARAGMTSVPCFENHFDLSHAGILLTIPALSACGLLKHTERFAGVTGYYTTEQIFIVLGFLSLLRVKNLEQSQTIPAGELGRCMGIDRIPEVKTLRERIAAFCREADVAGWSRELSREWMECSEDLY